MLGNNPGPKRPRRIWKKRGFWLRCLRRTPARISPTTRENIQILFRWLRDAETSVPLERYKLWSEGEENFEARWMKFWLCVSVLALTVSAGAISQKQKNAKGANEMMLAAIQPGRDS